MLYLYGNLRLLFVQIYLYLWVPNNGLADGWRNYRLVDWSEHAIPCMLLPLLFGIQYNHRMQSILIHRSDMRIRGSKPRKHESLDHQSLACPNYPDII
jgi:hypothetical protein